MKILAITTVATVLFTGFITLSAQNIPLKTSNLTPYGVSIRSETYKGKEAIILEQLQVSDSQKSFALLKDLDFHNGTLEITLLGQVGSKASETARGFVGLAFRVQQDTSKFELFYIRPTNGRAEDQVRRNHSVQYVSYPGFPWEKLRKETPEKYESYADLVPAEWTK